MELEYPAPPSTALPTMYDLPEEEIGQPGMPDLFHEWQGRLLDETFKPPGFQPEEVFSAVDMNLYYDVKHFKWHKRPDWFAVVGLPQEKHPGMRLSYVMWQENVIPLVVVELLSPSTRKDDLGTRLRDVDGSPTKWDVYEQWVGVPYYVTFDRRNDDWQIFTLNGSRYQKVEPTDGRFWIEEAELWLGLWHGSWLGETRQWLRWYDRQGNLIPTAAERVQQERIHAQQEYERAEQAHERAEQAHERAEQAHERAEREKSEREAVQQRAALLAEKLRALGVDPDQI
ncbi:MAG: Uma2 family endonuclease [Acidobacteria bacterium]|nr:Uma2 family endonuclease [Acidobacteriota bacterium]